MYPVLAVLVALAIGLLIAIVAAYPPIFGP